MVRRVIGFQAGRNKVGPRRSLHTPAQQPCEGGIAPPKHSLSQAQPQPTHTTAPPSCSLFRSCPPLHHRILPPNTAPGPASRTWRTKSVGASPLFLDDTAADCGTVAAPAYTLLPSPHAHSTPPLCVPSPLAHHFSLQISRSTTAFPTTPRQHRQSVFHSPSTWRHLLRRGGEPVTAKLRAVGREEADRWR